MGFFKPTKGKIIALILLYVPFLIEVADGKAKTLPAIFDIIGVFYIPVIVVSTVLFGIDSTTLFEKIIINIIGIVYTYIVVSLVSWAIGKFKAV